MKKLGFVAFLWVGLFLLSGASVYAQNVSDDFNDGVMNSSLWQELSEGAHAADVTMAETGQHLQWTSSSFSDGEFGDKGYISKWSFDLDYDFETSVDFHYSHEGTSLYDYGAVQVSLFNMGSGVEEPDYTFSMAAGNIYEGGSNYDLFVKYISAPGWTEEPSVVPRTVDSGKFVAYYSAQEDTLYARILDSDGGLIGEDGFENFRATFGLDSLGVAIIGGSGGAALASGEAYMDNFNATAAPEPVSTSLFLLGAG
ncbi:MAG: hypothetical protein ABIC68_04700, partial [Candidatus Omnitrophota bacterium]